MKPELFKSKLFKLKLPALIFALCFIAAPRINALCNPKGFLGMRMIAEMCWECILPISFAGVTITPGMQGRKDSVLPIYLCPPLIPPAIYFPIGFYEPALAVEVVSDPMCFPTFGVGNSAGGSQTGLFMAGSKGDDIGDKLAFYNAHILSVPVLQILGFLDQMCPSALAQNEFDLLGITEFYPQWQFDGLSAIVYPETALFAAPPLQLACMADSAAAQAGAPIDALFWCKGAWGGTYPLAGTTLTKSLLEDAASIGAGAIAFEHRNLALWRTWGGDTGKMCAGRAPQPIWDKSAYRMQLMLPASHPIASQIGEAGILSQWSSGKWKPMEGDNFSFLLFRKADCLLGR